MNARPENRTAVASGSSFDETHVPAPSPVAEVSGLEATLADAPVAESESAHEQETIAGALPPAPERDHEQAALAEHARTQVYLDVTTELMPGAAAVADPNATQRFSGGQETVELTEAVTDVGNQPVRHTFTTSGSSNASRYRPIRSHAKGGLGEVFVALDEELGREVALKEIQNRHADHLDSRRRFVLEAEVTGGLEHPGIVPVYGLGKYPDGRPYYAMRFIRGHSFKEAIDDFHSADARARDPGERTLELRQLLRRFIDVCNAMSYAHSRGVLHRDLKPANIMLGSFGETLVVDWGLAKPFDQPALEGEEVKPIRLALSGSGDCQTLFGSTVGTPSFMSPEQAAGRLDLLRPPSDVYSLGAILYNILTGHVPFSEPSLTSLLRKVQTGVFPPPRQVKPSVPRPLEAICLKAMAKQPEDRYPDARVLASDLEHWLADEPVSVYREPWLVRLVRWAKRHKTLVVTTTVLLATATVALAVGTVLIRREQQRTEVNFQRARDAVDQMLTELGEVELADVPQMEPVRRKMLDKALAFYQQFLQERGHDPWIHQETGRAAIRLGDIQTMLAADQAAERSYLQAIALLGPLVARNPQASGPRHDLAQAQHALGLLLKQSNRYDEAERALRTALQLRQALTRQFPARDDFRRDEKDTVYHLGALLARMPGRIEEVDDAYREAVAAEQALSAAHPDEPDYRRKLAQYLNNRGNLLKTRSPHEAESIYQEAIAILHKLTEHSPSVAANPWRLARSLSNLGATFEAEKRPEEAVAPYRDALARLQRLSDDFPSVPDYLHEVAAVENNLGLMLMGLNQRAEGEALLTEAATIYTKLTERYPARPAYRQKLAVTQRKHGILLANNTQKTAAEDAFRSAQATLRQLVDMYPKVPEYQSDLGMALDNLAFLLLTEKREAEARKCVEEAIEHQKVALASNPRSVIYREFLLMDFAYLERLLPLMGASADAASQAAADVLRTLPDEPRAHRSAARLLATATLLAKQDSGTSQDRRDQLAQSYAEQAVEHLRKAADGKVNVLKDLKDPVYDPLRDREDFQRLQKTLESTSQTAVG